MADIKIAMISFFSFRNHTKTYRTVRQRDSKMSNSELKTISSGPCRLQICNQRQQLLTSLGHGQVGDTVFFSSQSSPSGVFYYKLDRLSLTTHSHDRYHAKLLSTNQDSENRDLILACYSVDHFFSPDEHSVDHSNPNLN